MNEETFRDLAAYLTEICEVQNVAGHQTECDEDFSHTEQWLREKRFSAGDVQEAIEWLKERGIDCDCGVLWSTLGLTHNAG